jgi:carbonic anhydrase/acetyltransferase-like protein (isoleucine patch superfamily)
VANIFEFEGIRPVIHPTAFVHPNAAVTGHVTVGRDVYIGPGAALRGDWGAIEVGDGCNVQENCTIHMFPGITVVLEPGAHIGHGAIIHGARIGANALVGMNAVIMDDVTIGAGAIVGALSFVAEGTTVPDRMIAVGNPARVVKPVSDDMLAWKTRGTELYQALPARLHATLRPCEPLGEVPPGRPSLEARYRSWRRSTGRNEPSGGA